MGFTYDYYLTESQYENTIKTTRSNLLMRALVLKDEDAETYSEYLQPLPEERLNDLYYDTYVEDCDARRATGQPGVYNDEFRLPCRDRSDPGKPCLLLRAL